ncbi:MAG: LPS assembly lipoprotein LptE [Candidatus Binataceae bacterium]
MSSLKNRLCLAGLLVVLSMAGCGYTFSSADALPSSAHTIYVAKFKNMTNTTGIQDVFMRYMKDEIAKHDRLQLVDERATADLELSGTIVLAQPYPAAMNAVGEPTIYNLQLQVNATLIDQKTKKVLWNGQNLASQQPYGVVPQAVLVTSPQFLRHNFRSSDINQLTDSQVQITQGGVAQDEAMNQVAQSIYSGMASGF